jgi:hypothetical protein
VGQDMMDSGNDNRLRQGTQRWANGRVYSNLWRNHQIHAEMIFTFWIEEVRRAYWPC